MIIWEEPPNANRGRPVTDPEWLEELRSRPGDWAMVKESAHSGQVALWRQRYPDIKFTMRGLESGYGKVYAKRLFDDEIVEAQPARNAVGQPLGHALFGKVLYDGDRLVCGECGKSWAHLATHLAGAHGITAAEYREKYGLGRSTKLVAAGVREKLHAHTMSRIDDVRKTLVENRDPAKATRASMSVKWAPETRAKRQEIGRKSRSKSLTPDQADRLEECDYDLQAWADTARLILSEGASKAAIARATKLSVATVTQRMSRYPASGTLD